jgi:hypothetical protein
MNAKKIRTIRGLQAPGLESSGGTKILNNRERAQGGKEVKISADYTDYADFRFWDEPGRNPKRGRVLILPPLLEPRNENLQPSKDPQISRIPFRR